MKQILIVFTVVFFMLGCENTQYEQDIISLNGIWQFSTEKELSESEILAADYNQWDTLKVPGNWNTHDEYKKYIGKAYYERAFTVPNNWKGKQIRIQFDAVYQTSKVWVNGQLLGKHVGGYTPFEFNITDIVNYDKPNTVLVMADNSYYRGAWWPWGGISRDVTLIQNNAIRFVYQHISAIPNFETNMVKFIMDYKLENNSADVSEITINTNINTIANKELFSKELKAEIEGNSTKTYQLIFERDLSEFDLWDLESPNLYQVTSTVATNKVEDKITDKFGVRKIEARGDQLFLNNKPLYANGLNRVHDHPDFGNTEPDELVISDMKDIMALGGRMSRLMHAPLAKNILEFCDENGFLLIEEIPVWGDDDQQTFKDNPQTKAWLNELITRDYNHPSVIGWSVANELRENDSIAPWGEKALTKNQFEYINSMLDYVETLDTTRLKTYVGLTTYQSGSNMENEPYEKLDLICINSYNNALFAAEKTHEKFPGKPIFLSEIGIKQIGPAHDGTLSEELVNQISGLRNYPFVVGSSLWSYNDYKSGYKGTPASGFREWGVVNEKREPKKAYEQIKALYHD
ncbi:glycoside hydrolase family 2 [Tamlana sp. s12]|uniref:glycoside hydrolase family 2 protein n=1 Tax=Tamlana sp. s12 TaxID=1630406 RepID=UPI0007FF8C19|nr:glycoside hydrolase family 2 [Tamlana sp. s12]OBQ52827.1 glycoside hydrolase [Tamlana sp. s12]QQY81150.1 glycoside hydrolase family 2 [Tamlana sp. s12]